MRYTIILKKVIREIVGLITIVLFIYTCTKIRTTAGRKKAADHATIHTGTVVGFGWPLQITGYHPLLPRHGLPGQPYKRTFGAVSKSTASWSFVTCPYPANMGAGDQVTRVIW
ncbi:MAG TPA: hypothetical protein VF008_16330 [Niastella sp.]